MMTHHLINRKTIIATSLAVGLCFFIYNGVQIYQFSSVYSEAKSDVAIVLGAGSFDGVPSPVFRERINHGKYLFDHQKVDKIILTGGYGAESSLSDSEVAKIHLLNQGVPKDAILIERRSKYTIQNLIEAKKIMDALGYKSALIVTDPIHSKRAMALAKHQGIQSQPSPTQTTRYKSFIPKLRFLIYETVYYSLGKIIGEN